MEVRVFEVFDSRVGLSRRKEKSVIKRESNGWLKAD